jgi:hypothetical protein
MELRLTRFAARLAKQNVVIGVRVERRIEIDKIDTRIRELLRIPQPREIVTEIKPVHSNQQRKILDFPRNSKTVAAGREYAGAHFPRTPFTTISATPARDKTAIRTRRLKLAASSFCLSRTQLATGSATRAAETVCRTQTRATSNAIDFADGRKS